MGVDTDGVMGKKRNINSRSGWSPRTKVVVSAFVAFHVAAVFMAPFRFSTTSGPGAPVSPFAQSLMICFEPYVQALFLDHGYAFFAPDPGPSHLVRYEAHFADGRETVSVTFPDLEQHWPRLLYHRHFMLSEQLNMQFMPIEPPPELRGIPAAERSWSMDRRPYQEKWDAFVAHLKHVHDAERVEMNRVQHGLATVPEVREGMKLNDPGLYRDLTEHATSDVSDVTPSPATRGPTP